MNKIVERLQKEFANVPDLKVKEIKVSFNKTIYVCFIETVCSGDKINDYILKHLTRYNPKMNLNSNTPGSNTIFLDNYDKIEFYITNGFAIVIDNNEIIAIEVRGDLQRAVSQSHPF